MKHAVYPLAVNDMPIPVPRIADCTYRNQQLTPVFQGAEQLLLHFVRFRIFSILRLAPKTGQLDLV